MADLFKLMRMTYRLIRTFLFFIATFLHDQGLLTSESLGLDLASEHGKVVIAFASVLRMTMIGIEKFGPHHIDAMSNGVKYLKAIDEATDDKIPEGFEISPRIGFVKGSIMDICSLKGVHLCGTIAIDGYSVSTGNPHR